MNGSATCVAEPVRVKAGSFPPVPFGSEPGNGDVIGRCHDCDVEPGGFALIA